MKYFYFFLTAIFFSLSIQAQQAPFITTWEVTAGSLDITIPTHGTGYDYTIDFGDGTVQNNVTGDISYTYNTPGIYTVTISGDFPSIRFGNFPNNDPMLSKIQSVEQWGDIEWTSMDSAFMGCSSLIVNATDAPDLSQVTDLSGMFGGASSFNQSINHWDVSNVININNMFEDATMFNQPLNNWNVSNVMGMNEMFQNAQSFNQPLNNWVVSNVIFFDFMFNNAISFNQPLNNWDVANGITFVGMFQNAQSFNQDLSSWQFVDIVDSTGVIYGHLIDFLSNSGMDINNYDKFLNHLPTLGLDGIILGADNLEYCNSGARDYLINQLAWYIHGDSVSTSCNLITGTILYDYNNNGCDPNDIPLDGFMINAFDGTTNWTSYSSNGNYDLGVFGTNFTVSVVNQPGYFTVTPTSVLVTFTTSPTEIVDFCVTANQIIEDLNITLLRLSPARPGFQADYRIVVRNVGTETIVNVEATLAFDDLMQQFVLANPAPSTTTTNTLTFSIGTMQPFQKFEADITMLTFQPPTVNGGDILNFTAEVTPVANDHTPNDNTFNLAQVVVNSFDPNDKQVLQGEELHIDDIGEYLDYLIRFQNTGTASAINVRILDTLHPKLDWNTLIPISASHDYYIKITEGNRVEFMFDDIHLPDSLSNEPESHGFVAYKIKPKSNVQVGDIISGDAAIYFDFNAPIITNMVHTTVVEPLSITDVSNPLNQVLLYPNPTNKTLHIHLMDGFELQEVLIYDLQGKEVKKFQNRETTLDLEHLSPGMYLMKITTNQGTVNRQLIKN